MHEWWLAAIPVGAGAVGYLVRRWIEGTRKAQTLKRRLDALALLRGMRRERITLADLDRVERDAASGSDT